MASGDGRTVVLTGATGRLKGATARRLLGDGWRVRALTGTPASRKARAPGALGAEVVPGRRGRPRVPPVGVPRRRGVFGVQRPMALMELMSDRSFYSAASTWHAMPTLVGSATPIRWAAVPV